MEWGLKSGDSVMLLDDGGLDGGGRWLLTCPAGVSSPVARIDERGGGRGWWVWLVRRRSPRLWRGLGSVVGGAFFGVFRGFYDIGYCG